MRGLTSAVREQLRHERILLTWRILGNAAYLAGPMPAHSRGTPTSLLTAQLDSADSFQAVLASLPQSVAQQWVSRSMSTGACEQLILQQHCTGSSHCCTATAIKLQHFHARNRSSWNSTLHNLLAGRGTSVTYLHVDSTHTICLQEVGYKPSPAQLLPRLHSIFLFAAEKKKPDRKYSIPSSRRTTCIMS